MSAYSDLILASSPVAYWRLGESSGTTAADASGNSRVGTYSGTYTLGASSLVPSDTGDTSLGLGGAGYVSVAHDSSFVTSSAFTFIGRFKRTSTTGNQAFFHKGDFTVGGGQGVSVWSPSGTNNIYVEYFNGAWYYPLTSGILPGTDSFSFAFVYLGGTSAKFVIDGVATSVTLPVALPNSTQSLRIGCRKNTALEYYINGGVDEVAWFNSALSDSVVQNIHQSAVTSDTGNYSISASSSLSMRAGSLANISSGSTFVPQNAERAFTIPSASAASFITNQRNLVITSSSVTNLRMGTLFSLSSSAVLSIDARALLMAQTSIWSTSMLNAVGSSTANSAASINTKTTTALKGGYNAQTRMVLSGRTDIFARSGTISETRANLFSGSVAEFGGGAVIPSVVALSGQSETIFKSASFGTATTAIASQSGFLAYGIGATQARMESSSSSVCSFLSSVGHVEVPDAPDMSVYVMTANKAIHVVSA